MNKRVVSTAISIFVLLYIGLFICAYFFFDNVIFQPPVATYQNSPKIIKLVAADGVQISARHLPNSNAKYTILFSHGNGEDLGDIAATLEQLHKAGFAVFAYDYHGYGTSSGKPSEVNAYLDAEAAYRYVTKVLGVPSDQIILHGRSLGGAIAADLAARQSCGGLILESTFVTGFRVLTKVPLFPLDKFNTISKLSDVNCPILVIHGKKDRIVEFWHAEVLYAQAKGAKMNVWVQDAGHSDLPEVAGRSYAAALQRFSTLLKQVYEQK